MVLWLSIGSIVGGALGAVWFFEGTKALERKLWLHHIRNGVGIGGAIADLPDPKGGSERIRVPKTEVQRYTQRSFDSVSVSVRLQESLSLAFLVAVAGTVTAAYFLRQSGRSATEDRHIRGTTIALPEFVAGLARASGLPYDFTLASIPLFRDAETDHIFVCGTPGGHKGLAIYLEATSAQAWIKQGERP